MEDDSSFLLTPNAVNCNELSVLFCHRDIWSQQCEGKEGIFLDDNAHCKNDHMQAFYRKHFHTNVEEAMDRIPDPFPSHNSNNTHLEQLNTM